MSWNYEPPVKLICSNIETQLEKTLAETIYRAIQKVDVVVDKEELLKALSYDRNQYEVGFFHGQMAERYKKPENNYDWLRNLNESELAVWLSQNTGKSVAVWQDWLGQRMEEEK